MLMEQREEISHGTENVMKSESLDLQRVYNERPWVSGVKKCSTRSIGSRNIGMKRKLDSEDPSGAREKIRQEVMLTSLSSRKKNQKATGELGKEEVGLDHKGNSSVGDGGLNGVSLKLNGDVNIPKRPRDLVRRKKVDVDLASEEGVLGTSVSLGDGNGKWNGDKDGNLHHDGNGNGILAHNGVSRGAFSDRFIGKVKKNFFSDDSKENSSSRCALAHRLKRENSDLSVHEGDSWLKKAKRLRKKVREIRIANLGVSKEVKQLNESGTIVDETQHDEVNLEENAARMLSSRFDPSCTRFSSGGKISRLPFTTGLSSTIFSNSDFDVTHPTSLAKSNNASSDGKAGAFRPKDQQNGKSFSKRQRRFYEVLCRDFDAFRLLNLRIKVFWPLDKSWHIGHVTGYHPKKKLHHVKYDDLYQEWIDLQNERFKLFLLPSEMPGKVGKKRSTTQDNHSGKGKKAETADMESEPIISWLGRSSLHKSPAVGIRMRQRTPHEFAKSSLVCEGTSELMENLEVKSSGRDVDNLACGSDVPNNSHVSKRDMKLLDQKVLSDYNRFPIVYFRRRFQKKSQQHSDIHVPDLFQSSEELPLSESASEFVDSLDFGLDMLLSMVECCRPSKTVGSNEFIWDTDGSGSLKLIIPVTSLKVLRCVLSLPVPFVVNNLFGDCSCMFMLQRWDLISVTLMVRLEILFVDNNVGLRFLLFEGCLMQAISFVFLVLVVFQTSKEENYVGQQLPVTSIRFQFSALRSLAKQLVFTFYNFTEVLSSKWSYLDRRLSKHCVFTKQLSPPECTYDNISSFQNGCQLSLFSVPRKHDSVMDIHERDRQQRLSKSSKQSSVVKLSQVTSNSAGKLLPFALSFSAAPKFFISLHLQLLMEHSISAFSIGEQDMISLMDYSEDNKGAIGVDRLVAKDNSMISTVTLDVSSGALLNSKSDLGSCLLPDLGGDVLSVNIDGVIAKPSRSFCGFPENEEISQTDKNTSQVTESDHCTLSGGHFSADNQLSPVNPKVGCGPNVNTAIEIPSLISREILADAEMQNVQHYADSAVVSNDDVMHSPSSSPQSLFCRCKIGELSPSASVCPSPGWFDRKQDFLRNGLGNGPKKPRTQVSYSMSLGENDYNCKNNFLHGKGFSRKRIRRANKKNTSGDFGSLKRNTELLSCDVNCLVTVGDRGWRECGARVVLDLVNHSEWMLAVKMSGDTKYSHKAHQFLQPGTTNRYTHAMMWKGGKDWILEFTDRSQWSTFKEMHGECYNRNLRAASVKNIPIPGVRLIEENDDFVPEVPYMRPSSKYHCQLETDIDIAMNPSRVLYDMDSDDDRWVMKPIGLDFNERGCGDVSYEMFEKTMDEFEKLAYAKQCDHFSLDELDSVITGVGPLDTVINMYEYWREKRQRKGMPLIRHLQPPLWEKYQQQVKEWEQATLSAPPSGCSEKSSTVEKPVMFAFCLKPRGLEVPSRGSKQRSQKKLPVSFLSNGVLGDPESFHSPVGRRLHGFAFGDDRLVCSTYNQGASDFSPVLHGSTGSFSPRDAGGNMGYFSLNNDGFERNYYSKPCKIKSKKLCFLPLYDDQFASYNHRKVSKRSIGRMWNMGSSDWPSQINYQSDGFQRQNIEQVSPSELDEFRMRDAASAARHAASIAKLKRVNAQRMLCRADLAMHKAVAAIMTAEAVKASYKEPNNDVQMI